MTSTASQVTTPNWSDQQNTSNNNHDQTNLDHSTPQTSTTNYESPLRLQQRNTSSPAHQNPVSFDKVKALSHPSLAQTFSLSFNRF